jgi:hypothetical protein
MTALVLAVAALSPSHPDWRFARAMRGEQSVVAMVPVEMPFTLAPH